MSPWPPPHQCLCASKFRLVTWKQIVLAGSKKSLASTSCCFCHWLASVYEDAVESPNLTNETIVILNLSNCHKVHFHSGKNIFNAIPSCYHYNLLEKHKIISIVLMCYNLQVWKSVLCRSSYYL